MVWKFAKQAKSNLRQDSCKRSQVFCSALSTSKAGFARIWGSYCKFQMPRTCITREYLCSPRPLKATKRDLLLLARLAPCTAKATFCPTRHHNSMRIKANGARVARNSLKTPEISRKGRCCGGCEASEDNGRSLRGHARPVKTPKYAQKTQKKVAKILNWHENTLSRLVID